VAVTLKHWITPNQTILQQNSHKPQCTSVTH